MTGQAPNFFVCYLWLGPSQAKVAYLDLTVSVKQNICWLDVPVNNVGFGHEVGCTYDVVQNGFDMLFSKLQVTAVFHEETEVGILEIHHEEYVSKLSLDD